MRLHTDYTTQRAIGHDVQTAVDQCTERLTADLPADSTDIKYSLCYNSHIHCVLVNVRSWTNTSKTPQ